MHLNQQWIKDMKIERIQINKLKPATYNPRQITKKQYSDLKDSIDRFGLVDPIIINKNGNVVVGGHQRLKICKELKHTEIDCVVLDLNKEQERELNIRLNKSGGEWDFDLLSNFDIQELKEWGFKDIELGLNIDKIEEEQENTATITIKEDDLIKAQKLYNDLKEKGYNVKIK